MKKLKVLDNEDGFLMFLFSLALIAFLIYAGLQFGMPFYRHSAFKNDATELARISLGNVDKTKADILDRAHELKIPLEEKDIEVTKENSRVRVKASWSETVDLFGIYQKAFYFDINVEG